MQHDLCTVFIRICSYVDPFNLSSLRLMSSRFMVGFEDPGGLSCGCSLDLGKESWKKTEKYRVQFRGLVWTENKSV